MYGIGSNIIHFNALGNNIVVLNSMQAAKDLLDKRSAIYSDRYAFCVFMNTFLVGLPLAKTGFGHYNAQ